MYRQVSAAVAVAVVTLSWGVCSLRLAVSTGRNHSTDTMALFVAYRHTLEVTQKERFKIIKKQKIVVYTSGNDAAGRV